MLFQCKKNAILARRNFKSTLGQLVTPIIIVLLLLSFQKLSDYVLEQSSTAGAMIAHALYAIQWDWLYVKGCAVLDLVGWCFPERSTALEACVSRLKQNVCIVIVLGACLVTKSSLCGLAVRVPV